VSAASAEHRVHPELKLRDAFWPAQLTVALAIALDVALPERLTLGPNWLVPALEGVLLLALAIATPRENMRYSPRRRQLAVGLISLISLINLISLVLLVHYLIRGGKTGGHALILAGVVLWVTNVLIFGLWFWEMDRGGPVRRATDPDALPDFMFPQMDKTQFARKDWMPGYLDYMYLSYTNATAFSPTDTMPLTPTAKVLMTVQSLAALVTVGLVVARAVNILT